MDGYATLPQACLPILSEREARPAIRKLFRDKNRNDKSCMAGSRGLMECSRNILSVEYDVQAC